MKKIPLLFKDRRLEGKTTLRQCQLVQLHLLYVFDTICKEHNLVYFLGGGTLLGAMRHGGFIPWDDDLDVGMPRKDFEKFIEIAEGMLPKDVLLQCQKTNPSSVVSFAKLRDAYSFYCEMGSTIRTSDFLGIFMDIFPYDEMPGIADSRVASIIKRVQRFWWISKTYRWPFKGGFFYSLGRSLKARYFSLRYQMMLFKIRILRRFYPNGKLCLTPESGFTCLFEKDKTYPTKMFKFEDGEFPCPNDPDAFLTSQYGNWREVPPVEKRPRHSRFIFPVTDQGVAGSMKFPDKN